jgi:hypothetical protein
MERERVLCDKAYAAESKCMTSPRGKYGSLSPIGRSQFIAVSRIRQINERVIGRCKQWGLLKKQWSLSFDLHERCALYIAKLTQLQLVFKSADLDTMLVVVLRQGIETFILAS